MTAEQLAIAGIIATIVAGLLGAAGSIIAIRLQKPSKRLWLIYSDPRPELQVSSKVPGKLKILLDNKEISSLWSARLKVENHGSDLVQPIVVTWKIKSHGQLVGLHHDGPEGTILQALVFGPEHLFTLKADYLNPTEGINCSIFVSDKITEQEADSRGPGLSVRRYSEEEIEKKYASSIKKVAEIVSVAAGAAAAAGAVSALSQFLG